MPDFRDLARSLADGIKYGPHAITTGRRIAQRRPPESRRRYAAEPEAYFYDVLGMRLTPQQTEATHLAMTNDRLLIPSGNNVGKTFWAAGLAVFFFDAVASLPDETTGLEEQGCILLLPGPDHTTVKDTIWARILDHIRRAEERGFPMPGEWSENSVMWRNGPLWFARAFAPMRRKGARIAHSVSGRHGRQQIAIIEEGAGVEEAVWTATEGMCSAEGNKIISPFNPGAAAGSAWARANGGGYRVFRMSVLDHPNVRERRAVIPAAIDHANVEERVRLQCIDRGPASRTTVEAAQYDFTYALPPVPGAEGARSDGVPGHPDGEPRIYRPNPMTTFATQVLGEWGSSAEGALFDASAWDAGVERWRRGQQSALPPSRVGVDCAREGADDTAACPAWGRDAEDLLRIWREILLKTKPVEEAEETGEWWEQDEAATARPAKPAPEEVLERVRRSHRVRTGPIEIAPKGDGLVVSRWLKERYDGVPFALDESGVGASVLDTARQVYGQSVTGVQFGESPRTLVPGEQPVVNMRTQLFTRAAELVRLHLVDPPDDPRLREEVMAHRCETVYRQVHDGGKTTNKATLRLLSKDEVKDIIGRSPDRADAWVLSLFPVSSGGVGLW